ncbi:hypothetical protein M3Y94_00995700 [Aphelenchoides besseyi]|nr:hypothetical protein M3Y94_00995700 [Aphelenchoides besseyi]KAI6221194.1 hypothetical protein M3Y95_01014800 [Aphelenchoides besseyi]KAI6221202.1 hypothetical protein M3Y95_01015600 [Aphelenchoides besseyi]
MAIRRLDFPFTVPVFPDERSTVDDYSTSLECAVKILEFLVARIDATLELDDLPDLIDGELRSARGKILVLSRNNLQMFRRLVEDAENTVQGIQDLTGFWSLVCSEMRDVQQSIEKVEQHRKNKWKLPSGNSPQF